MKNFNELSFSDNFMFSAVLTRDLALCKDVLEVILEREISKITYANREQYFGEAPEAKAVRLDVYLRDDEKRAYTMEMQAWDEPDIAARSRYYQANMDLSLLTSGMHYQDLNEGIVIFVCTKDYFGRNLCKYTYENRCRETGEALQDRMLKIFLNAKGEDPRISEKLQELLTYISSNETGGELTERIEAAVKLARKDSKMQMEYLGYNLALEQSKREGKKEGIKEGIKKGKKEGKIIARYEDGMSVSEIAERMGESVDYVQGVIQENEAESEMEEELTESQESV